MKIVKKYFFKTHDKEVYDYVMDSDDTKEFMKLLTSMIEYLLPKYAEEGRPALVIGIGCTGGQHRSVSVAKALGDYISKKGYNVSYSDRDIDKNRLLSK